MKLANKVSIYNVLISTLVSSVISLVLFYQLLERENKQELKHHVRIVSLRIKNGLNWKVLAKDPNLSIDLIAEQEVAYLRPSFSKVKTWHKPPPHPDYIPETKRHKLGPPRMKKKSKIIQDVRVKNQWYRISFTKGIVSPKDLLRVSFFNSLFLFLLLLTTLYFCNRFLFHRIVSPFFDTLDKLKTYRISKQQAQAFSPSNIDEFNFLNETLTEFIRQSQEEYKRLKEFSENAAHELQTPLAIIKSKLDILVQSPNLKEKEYQIIEEVQQTLHKASNLNRTLLLINKIENKEFKASETIDVKKVIEQSISIFSELAELKKITLTTTLENFELEANRHVLDLLFNNLIHNAIKHNLVGGTIHISLSHRKCTITNSGKPLLNEPETYFLRFTKGNQGESSTGLGLAIAHQICKNFNYEINYQNIDNQHIMKILF